jgi:hypothetical protein
MTITTQEPTITTLDEETRRVLATAKGIIANGWCQGRAMDGAGRYCILGAVIEACGGVGDGSPARRIAALLAKTAGLDPDIPEAAYPITTWNDARDRTQLDVIDLIDKALALGDA